MCRSAVAGSVKCRRVRVARMPAFCRDCFAERADSAPRCPACGSPRAVRHPQLNALAIAHVDCDAFYATIEKRDDPSLNDKPLIIGGGKRGVVSTACYLARTYGVHSAMPMFKARALCPHATVLKPDMAKYVRVGREVRKLMFELTPQVEPLSIDEAFMDLTGTDRLHGMAPARSLARFARRIESEIGITVSIGLSQNKFLAKIASDLDKPRGFAVLGHDEAVAFLAPKPVGFIWGVGKASTARLQRDGFNTVADLQRADESDLMKRYGVEGRRLWRLSRGIDDRSVNPEREAKSVSSETTFSEDIAAYKPLEKILWSLSEKVSARLKSSALSGATVQLKLKTADFRLRTRARSLAEPTQLAARIFAAGKDLLAKEIDGTKFRLIGIGVSNIDVAERADSADFIDVAAKRTRQAEHAIDKVREKFGKAAVVKGLVFDGTIEDDEDEESTTSRPR
jgi:DNA polymerase IV